MRSTLRIAIYVYSCLHYSIHKIRHTNDHNAGNSLLPLILIHPNIHEGHGERVSTRVETTVMIGAEVCANSVNDGCHQLDLSSFPPSSHTNWLLLSFVLPITFTNLPSTLITTTTFNSITHAIKTLIRSARFSTTGIPSPEHFPILLQITEYLLPTLLKDKKAVEKDSRHKETEIESENASIYHKGHFNYSILPTHHPYPFYREEAVRRRSNTFLPFSDHATNLLPTRRP